MTPTTRISAHTMAVIVAAARRIECRVAVARRIGCRVVSGCAASIAALLLAACTSGDLPIEAPTPSDTPAADSLGTFSLTLTPASPATRATTTVITKEEADNFLVTIYKGSDIVRTATRLRDLNTSLSAGYGYRVMAENCTELEAITVNDGWGQKRFAGLSASFAIKAGQTTAVNVGCSVANAAVEVIFDESVAEYFTTSYAVTIQDGDRTIVFDSSTAGSQTGGVITAGRTAYFNLDANGEHPLTYTIHAVGPKELTKTGTLSLGQAKISRINLNYERSDFDFVITLDEAELVADEYVNITDDDIHVEDGTTEFLATTSAYTPDATAIDTRARLNDDGRTVSFADGDRVAVYDFKSEKRAFTAAIGSDGRTKFSGQVTPKSQSFAAIYPFDAAASTASSAATLAATLPTTQYAVASTLDPDLCFSVAKGERNIDGSPASVTFYNLPQLLRFSVPAYAENKITQITLTATTAIAGKLNINYSGDAPATSIATTESRTITILPPRRVSSFEAGTYYIAAAPVQMNGFTLTYTCDGKTYTQASTTTFGGQSGRIFELGSIDLINTPAVSVAHVYESSVLQGTRVTLTGAPIEGRQWSAVIKNAAGTTVRTISGAGDLDSGSDDASWPYLPKGSYTVTYSYTTSNGASRSADLALTIPAPTLTLTVDGYSAHTKYEAGDVTAANACERLTFYSPAATFSVSESLLANSNYAHSYVRSFNGQSATTNETTRTPSWSNYTSVPVSGTPYTFSVTANFAGESRTATKAIRITGLPANFNPPTKDTGWSNDAGTTEFESGYVRLGDYSFSQPHRIKNGTWFNIPTGVKLALEYNLALHRALVNTTANVKAGSQTIVTCNNTSYGQDVTNAGKATITTNANVTSVTCEGSYGSGATHTKVYKLNFKYGN